MKKRALSLFLVLTLCLGLAVPALAAGEVVQSGYCGGEGDGTNLSWTLTSDGTLTISGTGAMKDFYQGLGSYLIDPPWDAKIVTIVIQEGVTTIGDYAFAYCFALTNVTIPAGVTTIGESAFDSCHALTGVTLPGGLTTIGDYAFSGCWALTDVTLPESLTTIGDYAFWGCDALTSFTVAEDNPAYIAMDGALFNKDKTTLIQYPHGKTQDTYAVPDGVTTIGNGAFVFCKALTHVTIPEGVTTIGDYAFSGCTALTDMTLPEGLITIGDHAFFNCDALTSVIFPEGATTIGVSAFDSCSELTQVTLPASVTIIGDEAFNDCGALTDFTVAADNLAYATRDGVLFNKNMTTLIQYPIANPRTTYTIPDSVTTIGGSAFAYCSALTDVTIPDSVTTIGGSAFAYCSALTDVTFPESLTTIGFEAFTNCKLTDATFLGGTTTIGDCAFNDCPALTSVIFSAGTTTIGASAFEHCPALTDVTFSEGPTTIGGNAFFDCAALANVIFPEGPTTIGGSAFGRCPALTDVTFPEGLTSIGAFAFTCGIDYDGAQISVRFLGNVPQSGSGFMHSGSSGSSIFGGPFTNRALTIYYPEENSTWTDEADEAKEELVSGAYDVTWIPFDADPSEPTTYTVTVAAAQHGKVTADPTEVEAGTKITLTVAPDKGYELDTLTVKESDGKTVAVAADNTFTMPASNVTVSATFKALPVDRLSLSRSSVSVSVGGSASVTATVSGYAGKHVYAISSDTSVATVSVSGKSVRVQGVAQGAASVYVVMADTTAMTLDQAKADPSMKEIQVTVTKASSGGGGGGGGASGGSSSGGSTGGSTPTTPTTPESTTPASQTFGDVEKGSWYESGVTFVTEKGLFNGVGENQFAPQQNMTRAMLMTVLARLDGQSTDGGATWYSKGMDWAKAQGISDGTAPEGNITREQLVTMLYRYANSPAADGGLDDFADVSAISDWATDAMRWAVQNGILTGKGGARLDPQGLATRAEVATILQRYVNL